MGQEEEDKGRVNSNRQDMRHECVYPGGKSEGLGVGGEAVAGASCSSLPG